MQRFVAVIMAGGKGQRFWPLSTEDRPKQFLDLERCGRTLLQSSFDRLESLVGGPKHVFIATAQAYVDLVKEQLPTLPSENILVEPVGRDSAPAIALASLEIHKRYGEVITGFFPSDHRIKDVVAFQEDVDAAIALTEATRGITTIGIKPRFAATGYGYINAAEASQGGFKIKRFVEKPSADVAESYVQAGSYFWNAGMFVWHTSTVLAELDAHMPHLMQPLREAFETDTVNDVFGSLPKISIDYAVMEKTAKAYVVPGGFDWDDLGDWGALERLLTTHQKDGNTVVGRHVSIEATNNIVFTESDDDTLVTLGVEGMILVKRGNTVLLAKKDRIQEIKALLQKEELANVRFA